MRPAVWAPRPKLVELFFDGARWPMERDPQRPGWWIAERDLPPGARYGFCLDGGDARPDPRTLSQPDGVHGLSRVVDDAVLARPMSWTGIDLRGAVSYEIHIGAFTPEGTLDGAISRLDYLSGIGIDAVELMPLAASPGRWGWGYDGVAPWSVHEAYGGPEALVRFVDAAHAAGLGVILDVVHNHLGPEGNYLSEYGPYFTDRHHTPWGEAINLDGPGSDEVRAYLTGAARHFLVDIGVDGLRLDAVHALADDSARHFLAELSDLAAQWSEELGRPLTLIAESDLNQPDMVTAVGARPGARGMQSQWADDIHHSLHSFFSGERQGYYVDFGSAATLAKALSRVFVHDGGYSTFRGRDWGAPVLVDSPHYDGHSFVAFLQNHDQVGNRARGDRFHQHAGHAQQAAAAALYLLGPFTPLIFAGEEWAASSPFPYFSDLGPELGPLVTAGRAKEFAAMGWAETTPDPQAESTFLSAKLDWAERDREPHSRMLAWYRHLLALRRGHPELRNPRLAEGEVEALGDDTVAMRRGPFLVVATRAGTDLPAGDPVAGWNLSQDGRSLTGPGAAVLRC